MPRPGWRRPEYAPFLTAAVDLPDKAPSHLFASAARGFVPGEPRGAWFRADGGLVRLGDHLHASAEVSSGMRGSDDRSLHLTPGLIWRVEGLGEIGAGIAIGTGPAAGRAGLIVSLVTNSVRGAAQPLPEGNESCQV